MSALPLALLAYRAITVLLTPLAPVWLGRRAKAGKEDPARHQEREGKTDDPRPQGTLIWLHGASVGEAEVALSLMHALQKRKPTLQFLITSGTTSAAALIAARMDKHARHQYIPLDTPKAVKRFLDHWQPALGVFIESEIWPNLIMEAQKRDMPLALVNARMNAQSLRQWQRFGKSAARLFAAFSWIGAADPKTAASLSALTGQKIINTANLKLSSPPPMAEEGTLSPLKQAFKGRPVWLAVSTHAGEDEILLAAHAKICQHHKDAVLILVPRHPQRAAGIAALCTAHSFACVRHSAKTMPDTNTQIYIGDSIGEMGLWLRLGAPVFIGGSLLPAFAGHNPVEAAKLNVPILTGPHFASFATLYEALLANNAVGVAAAADSIAEKICQLWQNPAQAKTMVEAAQKIVHQNAQAPLERTMNGLLTLIEGKS